VIENPAARRIGISSRHIAKAVLSGSGGIM
jgi:hypothetical protein